MAAEVSRGLARHGWSKRRSSTNGVGNIDGNGKVLWQSKRRGSRKVALVLDQAKASSVSASRWFGPGRRISVRKILRVLCGYFEHERPVQFEGCVAEPLQTITAFLPGSKWSCSLLRIVLQDALSEVTKIYPPLKLKVFVDDITALLTGENRNIAEVAKKVMKKLKEVEKKGLKMSVAENGKEGKSKIIASCGFLENYLRQFSRGGGGVTLADSVETLGVDLRTGVKRLGAKEKARRKKCKVRCSLMKKNKAFQKSYMKVECQEVDTCRCDASKDLGSPCNGDV